MVSIPSGTSSNAIVRCPLCQEEYTISEARDRLPAQIAATEPLAASQSATTQVDVRASSLKDQAKNRGWLKYLLGSGGRIIAGTFATKRVECWQNHVSICLAWIVVALALAIMAPFFALELVWLGDLVHVTLPVVTFVLIVWNLLVATRFWANTGRTSSMLPLTLLQFPLFTLLFYQISRHIGEVPNASKLMAAVHGIVSTRNANEQMNYHLH